jgi:arylsulfatase A-like enzyme
LQALAPIGLGAQAGVNSGPNFIVIVPDDHRWDATSAMQKRMASDFGRVARFPFLTSPDRTPNLDRLADEGLQFDNGFVVFSLCSPSRATMLTGVQPFVHGVTANDDAFDVDAVTYATLLREAGWQTGYFGKWHMGTQTDRPGFDHVRTFYGQGDYFGAAFYDETKTLVRTTGPRDPGGDDYDAWVDKVATDYLLEFIDQRAVADERFVAFLGFKTPHDPRITGGLSNAPSSPDPALNFSALFDGASIEDVPNLLSQNGSAPVWKPDANKGSGGANTIAYMQMIAAIDAQVGRVLDRLDDLGLADNTVVVYLSDNGYFRGEHGLGDKRAGYEESLRVPFIMRYPAIQPGGAGLAPTPKIALNMDLAPTLLDIAGLPIPAEMQGRSLKPLLEGTVPADWRDAFVFSYNEDPEFAAVDPADMVGIRTEDGRKLIRYAENSGWDELFDVSAGASADQKYENINLIGDPNFSGPRDALDRELDVQLGELGLLRKLSFDAESSPLSMTVLAGDQYPFLVERSDDLVHWSLLSELEGGGQPISVDLPAATPDAWDVVISGEPADYILRYNPETGLTEAVQLGNTVLRLGFKAETGRNDRRDAVLIFELPVLPPGEHLELAQLEIFAGRQFARFDVDLWSMGVFPSTAPVLTIHRNGAHAGVKLQDNFMDHRLSPVPQFSSVQSRLSSGLSSVLRDFYAAHPDYAGGQYLFLRLDAALDQRDQSLQGNDNRNFRVTAGNDAAQPPSLSLLTSPPPRPNEQFYRIRHGKTAD